MNLASLIGETLFIGYWGAGTGLPFVKGDPGRFINYTYSNEGFRFRST
jgi:hypothetical protein